MTRLPLAGRLALAGAALAATPAVAAAVPSTPVLDAPPAVAQGPDVAVSWSAATFDPLSAGQRYALAVSRLDGATETPVTTIDVDAPGLGATVSGLADGTYRLRVTASELPCLDDPPGDACAVQATDPDGRLPGLPSAPAQVTIDGTAPGATMNLNGGAEWATDRDVATGLEADDASPMRMVLGMTAPSVTCDVLLCGTPFAPDPVVTLPDADGPHTVFARVVDAAGNERVVSDGITLDQAAPDLWGSTSELEVETGQPVEFTTREATDAGSGLVESSFRWSFCLGADCLPDAAGRGVTRTFAQPGAFLVSLRADDVAGNTGIDSFILTVTPPSPAGGGDDTPTPAAPGPAGQGATGGGSATPAGPARANRLLKRVAIVGTPRVGRRVAVKVTLARRSKVVFDVLSGPGSTQTLLAKFAPRKALRKGTTVFRLPAPSRAATRVLRVRAGSDVWQAPLRIRRR
jgi:hypothetical protein